MGLLALEWTPQRRVWPGRAVAAEVELERMIEAQPETALKEQHHCERAVPLGCERRRALVAAAEENRSERADAEPAEAGTLAGSEDGEFGEEKG